VEGLNLCSGCGEDFTSVFLFDLHRVGVHAYTFSQGMGQDTPVENGRRCLDPEEMEAKGWRTNEKGRWYSPERSEKVSRYFSGLALASAEPSGLATTASELQG
jgi:hypothetical protein